MTGLRVYSINSGNSVINRVIISVINSVTNSVINSVIKSVINSSEYGLSLGDVAIY